MNTRQEPVWERSIPTKPEYELLLEKERAYNQIISTFVEPTEEANK